MTVIAAITISFNSGHKSGCKIQRARIEKANAVVWYIYISPPHLYTFINILYPANISVSHGTWLVLGLYIKCWSHHSENNANDYS